MKLSEQTVSILKNFSGINQNILVKHGAELRTMSTMKNILGEAVIPESFPRDFGIYDLNEFLGVLTLVKDPELEFDNDSYMTVNSGRSKIKYFYSDPSILTTPPETFNAPECDVNIEVSEGVLDQILKASAVMQLPDIIIKGETQSTFIEATDLKNATSNKFTLDITNTDADYYPEFNFHFKSDNLKMIKGNYKLSASTAAGVSNWLGKEASYWIAMEAKADG
jgi:hypothetical protein